MENKFEYTKGPWKVDREANGRIGIVIPSSPEIVAVVNTDFDSTNKKYNYTEEEINNAHLMAVVPELYEALKLMRHLLPDLANMIDSTDWKDIKDNYHYIKDLVDSVLKKVEGNRGEIIK